MYQLSNFEKLKCVTVDATNNLIYSNFNHGIFMYSLCNKSLSQIINIYEIVYGIAFNSIGELIFCCHDKILVYWPM
jgi:hypothetical protein